MNRKYTLGTVTRLHRVALTSHHFHHSQFILTQLQLPFFLPPLYVRPARLYYSSTPLSSGKAKKTDQEADWVTSSPLTRKKSIFIARAAHVTSEEAARAYLRDLIASDKKVAKATHNITAWRIKGAPHHQQQYQHVQGLKSTQGSTTSTTTTTTTTTTGNDIQNSDDDGESAAGGKLLTLLQMMDAWNVMVVVTRWFGGVKLGPERFRVINAVAKEALDKGGWNKSGQSNESNSKTKDTKKKKKRS